MIICIIMIKPTSFIISPMSLHYDNLYNYDKTHELCLARLVLDHVSTV